MLLETYPSETDKPADRAAVVQERPMELDRAQAKRTEDYCGEAIAPEGL
jgi:hypothetical protein